MAGKSNKENPLCMGGERDRKSLVILRKEHKAKSAAKKTR